MHCFNSNLYGERSDPCRIPDGETTTLLIETPLDTGWVTAINTLGGAEDSVITYRYVTDGVGELPHYDASLTIILDDDAHMVIRGTLLLSLNDAIASVGGVEAFLRVLASDGVDETTFPLIDLPLLFNGVAFTELKDNLSRSIQPNTIKVTDAVAKAYKVLGELAILRPDTLTTIILIRDLVDHSHRLLIENMNVLDKVRRYINDSDDPDMAIYLLHNVLITAWGAVQVEIATIERHTLTTTAKVDYYKANPHAHDEELSHGS